MKSTKVKSELDLLIHQEMINVLDMFSGLFSFLTMKFRKSEKTIQQQQEEKDADARFLRQIGYTQELYRGFSPFMSFSFCFTAVNVLTAISLGFTYQMNRGGSGVAIWSWIIGSFFTILIGFSLAEICSVYPSAGSVYHWSGMLVPLRYAPLASFTCGWFNFFGNVAGDAAFASGFATMVNTAVVLNGKSSLNTGEQVGIAIAITFVWTLINTLRIDKQGWINNIAAFFQISSVIIIVIVLLVMAPERATATDVFTSTYKNTEFSFGYVYCIGILSTLFIFSGYEAGAHLAEETRGATRAAPRSIVGTCVCSAIFGIVYLLALLFVIPDVTTFMSANSGDNETINLAVAVFQSVLPHEGGALALTILLIVNLHFAGTSSMTVTSRIGFAMARDGIFPFSKQLRWIWERKKIPLVNVIFVLTIDTLFLLLQLVSETAFSSIIAVTTLGYQISYLMPILFRCTTARHTFHLGEFNLGRFSIPTAIISCIWLSITSILMFFPFEYPITKDNMNYAIVIIGGVALIASIYWIFWARHFFVGPKPPYIIDPMPLPPGHVTAEGVSTRPVPNPPISMVSQL
ncbi:unnamed protein product [Adineta steineri]|uniref:Uncharacterized protein n=1 Tax=Adineta steineri TaxID=433720 RepID=A0A819M550_9BILA|nr:unnamed protein product [Adineta steineri]CAF3974053.1 unnamed protein product [Adineta steineri]